MSPTSKNRRATADYYFCISRWEFGEVIFYIPGERELMCILKPNTQLIYTFWSWYSDYLVTGWIYLYTRVDLFEWWDGFICMMGWIYLHEGMGFFAWMEILQSCNFWYKWKELETISIYTKIRIDLFWLINKIYCFIYILTCSFHSVQLW